MIINNFSYFCDNVVDVSNYNLHVQIRRFLHITNIIAKHSENKPSVFPNNPNARQNLMHCTIHITDNEKGQIFKII